MESATLENSVVENSASENQNDTSAVPLISRPSLQRWLIDYGVAISDDDLGEMTETQAEVLWDWMESHVHNDEDSEAFEKWISCVPDFVTWGEPNGETRTIVLVRDAQDEEASTPPSTSNTNADANQAAPKTATEKHLALIQEASERANHLRDLLLSAESDVRAAKGREKECRENLDKAEIELSRVIADSKSGQQRLPFDEDGDSSKATLYVDGVATDVPGGDIAGFILNDAKSKLQSNPIDSLSQKSIKTLIGADAFDAAKDADDPVGLTDSQIEKLVEAEIETVEKLEKWIAEDAHWHRKISGFGQKAIDRVSSTLVAFRRVKPVSGGEIGE